MSSFRNPSSMYSTLPSFPACPNCQHKPGHSPWTWAHMKRAAPPQPPGITFKETETTWIPSLQFLPWLQICSSLVCTILFLSHFPTPRRHLETSWGHLWGDSFMVALEELGLQLDSIALKGFSNLIGSTIPLWQLCHCHFFPSLMMLHVPLMTLQGSTEFHFSFQITNLPARKGDQKQKKKLKKLQIPLSEPIPGLGRSPALQSSGRREAHVWVWECGSYVFLILQCNDNSLWMQS